MGAPVALASRYLALEEINFNFSLIMVLDVDAPIGGCANEQLCPCTPEDNNIVGVRFDPSPWRAPHMKIEKILAVYSVSPPLLVVESDESELFEFSLNELKNAGYSFSDAVWKSLIEDYQIFNCERVRH